MAELMFFDIPGAYNRGQAIGTQQRQMREAEQRDNSLNELAKLASQSSGQQRQDYLTQAMGVDRTQGAALGESLGKADDRRTQSVVNMARLLTSAPAEARAGLYQQMHPSLAQMGFEQLPQVYDATTAPLIDQSAQAIVQAYGKAQQDGTPAAIRELQMLRDNPELAELDMKRRQAGFGKPQLIETEHGYVWATPSGASALRFGQAPPQSGYGMTQVQYATEDGQAIPPSEQDELRRAMQAASRGEDFTIPVGGQPLAPTNDLGPRLDPVNGGYASGDQVRPKEDRPNAPSGYEWNESGGLSPIAGGPEDPNARTNPDRFKDEQAMRKELATVLKEPQTVVEMYKKVEAAAANPSAANDLAMIFGYMKMLDPGSVVREAEFANAQNAAGVPDQIRNLYNRARSGQRLNDRQRAEFLQSAQGQLSTAQRKITQETQRFQQMAERYNFDPSSATGRPDFRNVAGSSAQPVNALTAGTVEDGYRFTGGDPSNPANWERL